MSASFRVGSCSHGLTDRVLGRGGFLVSSKLACTVRHHDYLFGVEWQPDQPSLHLHTTTSLLPRLAVAVVAIIQRYLDWLLLMAVCCRLLWFPRPNLLLYTVLVLPAVYAASKLCTQGGASLVSVVSILGLPLPVIAMWVYVLFFGVRGQQQQMQRSQSAILQAYSPQVGAKGSLHKAYNSAATLALLGDAGDNPTLIIRDRKPGEEEFDRFAMAGDSSEDSSDDETQHQAWDPPAAHISGGVQVQAPACRLRRPPATTDVTSNTRPLLQRMEHLPGQSADGVAGK